VRWKRGRNCSWSSRFPFKVCRIIERLELKEWFCLIALHAGSAHFTERYGVRALERLSANHSIEQSQNTSNGWWTAQGRIKAQRATVRLHHMISPGCRHFLLQSTHRFTPNYIYKCTAQWVYTSQGMKWMKEKCTERILVPLCFSTAYFSLFHIFNPKN